MVSITINLDEKTAKLLEEEARQRGTTVDELVALGARLVVDTTTSYDLTDEQEAELERADQEVARGEFFTKEELFARLKAQQG